MNLALDAKTAVICGGSEGIGKAIAIRLVAEGCKVLLLGRTTEKLIATKIEIVNKNPLAEVSTLSVDVGDPNQSHIVYEYAVRVLNRVDILINSIPTIFTELNKFSEASDLNWEERFREKFLSYTRMTRLFLPGMELNQFGRIIHIAGLTGKEPSRVSEVDLLIAGVINAAIINFSKSLSLEYAASKITVNVINPGFIVTERFKHYIHHLSSRRRCSVEELKEEIQISIPAKRLGTPEEVACLAMFLASPDAGYITGQCISVDGGYSRGIF